METRFDLADRKCPPEKEKTTERRHFPFFAVDPRKSPLLLPRHIRHVCPGTCQRVYVPFMKNPSRDGGGGGHSDSEFPAFRRRRRNARPVGETRNSAREIPPPAPPSPPPTIHPHRGVNEGSKVLSI